MATLQQQIADLRRRLSALPADARAAELTPLEADARALLTASKNTPYEEEARALFAELAQRSARPAPVPESGVMRGILRRARIRMELAGDEDDYDAAIDILAGALEQDPENAELQDLLRQAAGRSAQLEMKVRDLLAQYGMKLQQVAPPPPPAPLSTPETPSDATDDAPATPTSTGTLAAAPPPVDLRRTTQTYSGEQSELAALTAEITNAYYAGDYQKTVDLSNRALSIQADNPTALDYRGKAEDNLVRGVVPDHRIPFEARVAYNRANSLVRAGNYDEAERLYREARDIAERAGIPSWKDAEQALLDIQDLSLAREMLNDGDRLLAADDWTGALRKYEGALRVVSSDPMAQDRIDLIKRVQDQYDRASVQLNLLAGTPTERAANLQSLIGSIGSLRQLLPGSNKLQALLTEAEKKLSTIKGQLLEQGRQTMTRAEQTTVIDDKLRIVQEAVKSLELAANLDNADSDVSAALESARTSEKNTLEAKQTLERAAALTAQNFDAELAQARTMLTNLRDYGQDPRYRMLISDLLARHLERVELSLDRRNAKEAERWLSLAKDEPFRALGRRSELLQLEEEARALKRQATTRNGAIGFFIVVVLIAGLVLSRPVWIPLVNPPTATNTPTPSNTATPSRTFTPTLTPSHTFTATATFTPSFTYTPSRTWTPSNTPTESPTPSETFTPTFTPTPSDTFTPTLTPTITPTFTPTNTPSITPTPLVKCQVVVLTGGILVRSRPSLNAQRVTEVVRGTIMEVLEQRLGTDDGYVWYNVRVNIDSNIVPGWVRADVVSQKADSPCPPFP